MDIAPFIPVITEATKFMFDEVGKWIDDVRQRSNKTPTQPTESNIANQASKLTRQDFVALEADPEELESAIKIPIDESTTYEIQGLIKQIQIHRRSLIDYEVAEAELGVLPLPYIKHGIKREADAIVDKTSRLKSLLEQVYGRSIENV